MFGIIKKYDPARAFGWIAPEGQHKLRFFHISNFSGADLPLPGMRVQFVLAPNPRKPELPDECIFITPSAVKK